MVRERHQLETGAKCTVKLDIQDDYVRVLSWQYEGFLFRKDQELNTDPLPAGELMLRPGDLITAIGGKHTSAGFTRFKFPEGDGLIYRGTVTLPYKGEATTMICGDLLYDGELLELGWPEAEGLEEWPQGFFGWLQIDRDTWMHTTRAIAGRLVELRDLEVEYQYERMWVDQTDDEANDDLWRDRAVILDPDDVQMQRINLTSPHPE